MWNPLAVVTSEKDFSKPLIGNHLANAAGLHVARILAADGFDRIRWAMWKPTPENRPWIDTLRRDGVVAVTDFLPPDQFEKVRSEAVTLLRNSLNDQPRRDNRVSGFGAKEPFGNGMGFDRFDGGTLNRFIHLSPQRTPVTLSTFHDSRIRNFYAAAQGRDFPDSAVMLYYLRHGPQNVYDDQKDFHRDTFHFTIKFWYFLEDAGPETGPFIYVKGSNRSNAGRLKWEYDRSLKACRGIRGDGGSFRATEQELKSLGLPEPTVMTAKANTLVIADTHGFHRRGDAAEGAERLSVYGGMRRSPYWFSN